MNDFQRANLRRQIMRALRMAGAKTYTVTRTLRDANGMTTGETQEVGRIYGLRYARVSELGNLLQIAMPGIVMQGGDADRWCGVMLQGDTPQQGDTLRAGDEGVQIAHAQEDMGVITLFLGGAV